MHGGLNKTIAVEDFQGMLYCRYRSYPKRDVPGTLIGICIAGALLVASALNGHRALGLFVFFAFTVNLPFLCYWGPVVYSSATHCRIESEGIGKYDDAGDVFRTRTHLVFLGSRFDFSVPWCDLCCEAAGEGPSRIMLPGDGAVPRQEITLWLVEPLNSLGDTAPNELKPSESIRPPLIGPTGFFTRAAKFDDFGWIPGVIVPIGLLFMDPGNGDHLLLLIVGLAMLWNSGRMIFSINKKWSAFTKEFPLRNYGLRTISVVAKHPPKPVAFQDHPIS
ncbi:MAG: hypothetical protein JST40_08115 [Armatimonadetes bacterium]|nr:hypothetical protein [Armatimonadota bacterium]